jgi:hypothetical protein
MPMMLQCVRDLTGLEGGQQRRGLPRHCATVDTGRRILLSVTMLVNATTSCFWSLRRQHRHMVRINTTMGLGCCLGRGQAQGGAAHHVQGRSGVGGADGGGAPAHQAAHRQPRVCAPRAPEAPGPHGGAPDEREPAAHTPVARVSPQSPSAMSPLQASETSSVAVRLLSGVSLLVASLIAYARVWYILTGTLLSVAVSCRSCTCSSRMPSC